ncbi:MAG TPA: tetratricopeptide repeat protein, partial [Kofleriaceae bacterium]
MTRVFLRLVLLGAIGTVAAPAIAAAQTAPIVDKKQLAKQYVDAGLAAQSAGDYDTAITFYSKAYDLVPHPTLLFNLAQAHRLAGRIDQALALYRRYLSEDPKGPHARTARDLVSEIEARKAEQARSGGTARPADEGNARAASKPDPAGKPDGKPDAARTASEPPGTDGARKPDAARKASEAPAADEARNAEAREAGAGQPPRPQV